MGNVLRGSARTTPRRRAELQAPQESSRTLAARYGLNPKAVREWRERATTADAPMGPRTPKSTAPTPAEEATRTRVPLVSGMYFFPSKSPLRAGDGPRNDLETSRRDRNLR